MPQSRGEKRLKTPYHIVIPARMASQRLPGKPLLEIAGVPLVGHVYRCACRSSAQSVSIATDDARVAEAATHLSARAVMTSDRHESGSDRIAECADRLGWADDAVVVNLQGDEPLMPPACLDQVAGLLADDPAADAASLYWPIQTATEVADPNVVKVVVAADGYAMYFSRSPVPYPRGRASIESALAEGLGWRRHIGLYAYRVGALRAFAAMPPAPLERAEKLEQLRLLEAGRRIRMAEAAEFIPAGVDTEEDLERVRRLIEAGG